MFTPLVLECSPLEVTMALEAIYKELKATPTLTLLSPSTRVMLTLEVGHEDPDSLSEALEKLATVYGLNIQYQEETDINHPLNPDRKYVMSSRILTDSGKVIPYRDEWAHILQFFARVNKERMEQEALQYGLPAPTPDQFMPDIEAGIQYLQAILDGTHESLKASSTIPPLKITPKA